MLTITRVIKDALVAAGFDRRNISVSVPNKRGQYGDPSIIVFGPLSEQIARIDAVIAQNVLDVHIFVTIPGEITYPRYQVKPYNRDAVIEVIDMRKPNFEDRIYTVRTAAEILK